MSCQFALPGTKSNNKVTDFANEVALLLVSVSPGPRGKGTKENQKEKKRDKKKTILF